MSELLRYAYDFPDETRHEQSLFEPLGAVSYPYLSKKPSDAVRLEKVAQADQDLYVIAMFRDPRSVITSKHWSSKAEDGIRDFCLSRGLGDVYKRQRCWLPAQRHDAYERIAQICL